MEAACRYRCHSALKLLELDKKFNIFTRTHCTTVLDLAAAPGGFAQVALEQMNGYVNEKYDDNNNIDNNKTLLERSQTHNSQDNITDTRQKKENCKELYKSHFAPKVIAVDLRPIAQMPHLHTIRCNLLKHQEVLFKVERVLQSIHAKEQQQEQQASQLMKEHCKEGEECFTPDVSRSSASNKECLSVETLYEGKRSESTMMELQRHTSEFNKHLYQLERQQRSVDVILHDGVSVIAGQDKFSPLYAQNQMTLSTLLLACKMFDKFTRHKLVTVNTQTNAALQRYNQKSKTQLVYSSEQQQQQQQQQELLNVQRSKSSNTSKINAYYSTSKSSSSLSSSLSSLITDSTTLPVCFVSKLLRSSHSDFVVDAFHTFFHEVYLYKPESSYAWNKESYLVAFDFDQRQWHNALRGRPIYKNISKSRAQTQQTKNCCDNINSNLSTIQKHSRAKRESRQDMTLGQVVFSMHPYRTDAPHEANQVVWRCLGCGQCRIGCVPCMVCSATTQQR